MLLRCLLVLVCLSGIAAAQECKLVNPTRRQYSQELLRLTIPPPAGEFRVAEDGTEIPFQVEEIAGRKWVWVCSDFAAGASRLYRIEPGKPKPFAPQVTLRKEAGTWLLENAAGVAVRVPAEAAGAAIPGPIAAVRMAGKWVGTSHWRTDRRLRSFSATPVGNGTLLAKVRLRYDFEGDGVYSEIDVAMGPGWEHAEVFERHAMGRRDGWELELSRGWSPREGVSVPFSKAGVGGPLPDKGEPTRPLKPGGLPYQDPALFINLLPRWNQHYKDGWYFAANDGANQAGAIVVSASRWIWPHDNNLRVLVRDSGDWAAVQCSTWHGQRLWWLIAGPVAPPSTAYVARHAWERLDKLNHEFILDWPGKGGSFSGMDFYDFAQMNPTGGIRGAGRSAIANAAKTGDIGTLTRAQVMLHPDAYGTYHNYWSPENPNFFTDFFRVPIALVCSLREHPRFEELRKLAEARLREDVDHSVTLPGGAGQECPGYLGHGLNGWASLAPICRQYLGFDPTTWERYKAAERFRRRISQPDGEIRRALPMGDTHPAKDGPKVMEVPAEEVKGFATEELPGFGVIFSHRAGTPRETYVAFKAGPNRGHYHGDQLAIHWCADARPLAVDHHCSYNPRAGQEHMHNRLAFGTEKMPWANMDGYERLIAFKTSAEADVAVAQVESNRLRQVNQLPPENWHQEFPQHALKEPLVYRRTVLLLKGGQRDALVIRDQYRAGEALRATYCLHVRSDKVERKGAVVDFGNLVLHCAQPQQLEFEPMPWSHRNGGGESTQGARLTVAGASGQFITALVPGAGSATSIPGGVKVGDDEVIFGDETAVTLRRGGKEVLVLRADEIDLNRPQGKIGLFVPDAGYPFGEIPDWLIRQRAK